MDSVLKEVLIKKCGNRKHDQVLIIENLPSKFLFEQTRKMVPRVDRDGYMDGTMAVDKSGEMVWTLYPGIEKSQTGDGGYCFWVGDRESEERLKDIMRFVDMSFPRDQRLPEFVDNAQLRGESNTGPIAVRDIPRISLPAPVEKVSPAPVSPSQTAPSVRPAEPSGSLKKGWTDERRAEAAARMKKLQEERKSKKAVAA